MHMKQANYLAIHPAIVVQINLHYLLLWSDNIKIHDVPFVSYLLY